MGKRQGFHHRRPVLRRGTLRGVQPAAVRRDVYDGRQGGLYHHLVYCFRSDYQYFYVRVEDSGIGIPKENQDMVFERFYRVDKARSRETGGTGLGLAIVKKIILMHHGTIKMHSEEDVGTTFTVRIPLNYVQSDTEQEGRLS